MKQLKLLFIVLFLISIQKSIQSQELKYTLKLPPDVRVVESYVLSNNSDVYLLTLDGAENYKFYKSSIQNEKDLSAALPIDGINAQIPAGVTVKGFSLSVDNHTLLFSANLSGGFGGFDIYKLIKKAESWSEPQNLGKIINSTKDDMEPSISADGNTIYFTRPVLEENDFTDDFDCKKIFVAEKNINSEWEEPYELTKPMNLYCECSPRIAADNKTLYYSSVRGSDENGFDIYYTQQIAKKIWKTPVKIDTLSTEANDLSLSFSANQNFYIYSRIPQKFKSKVATSLYRTPFPSEFKHDKLLILQGKVYDLYTNNPIEAKIEVANPESKRILARYNSNQANGEYYLILPSGGKYNLSVFKDGYSYRFEQFDVLRPERINIVKKNFTLYSSISLFLNVFDAEDFSSLDATIQVKKKSTGEDIKIRMNTKRKGQYILGLDIGQEYIIRVEAENHLAYEMPFSLDEIVQFSDFERDVELAPTYENLEFDVSDMQTDLKLDSIQIIVVDAESGEEIKAYASMNSNGKYDLKLKKGKKYRIKVKAPKGYAFYNTEVDLNKEVPKVMDVKLEPLNAETKLTFNSIQFESNSAELDVNSFTEISELIELLLDNTNMKVEISAHTDDVGSEVYNQRLSDKRARSVVDYIIKNGIAEAQLIARGYGESTAIAPNDNDENRAKNRRVELRILDVNIENNN